MPVIVIIEEDVSVRSLLTEWLTAEGYAVSGVEDTSNQPVGLVIVDVYMPRDRGVERLARVRRAYPGAAVIAISGLFSRKVSGTGELAESLGVYALIAKPFDRNTLINAVEAAVGSAKKGTVDALDPCAAGTSH